MLLVTSPPPFVQMVSCGADKSIIFRDVNTEDSAGITLSRVNHIVGKTTLYDMELDRYNLGYFCKIRFLIFCLWILANLALKFQKILLWSKNILFYQF
jgi:hypothetical protein